MEPRMSVLRTLSGEHDPSATLDIIAIPGVRTRPAKDWPICSINWAELFPEQPAFRARILNFEYDLVLDDSFSWRSILILGNELLEDLNGPEHNTEIRTRPTLFVCHSLGGLILKQALSVANQQLYRFRDLFACISGIILMGTPHSSIGSNGILDCTMLILRAFTKFTPKPAKLRLADEASILKELAIRFDDVHLRVPILSVYETRSTKVREGIFHTRKLVLVSQSISTTNTPLEERAALDRDHGDLCLLQTEDGIFAAQILEFVKKVMKNAQRVVDDRVISFDTQSLMNESLARSKGSVWGEHQDTEDSGLGIDTNAAVQPTGATGSSSDMGSMISDFSVPSRHAKIPCFMIEPHFRNKKFYGREDILLQLDAELLPADDKLVSSQLGQLGLRLVAIYGLGGVGKTEIAVEWAFSRRIHFDAVFWITADEQSKLATSFCQIALQLNLEESGQPQNPIVSRELVKGWLSNPRKALDVSHNSDILGQEDANWLLIFDNVNDINALNDYWPVVGSGSLLITSRDPLSRTVYSENAPSIDLGPFANTEGALFLRQLTRISGEDAKSEQIVERLGGLPLAIVQMAEIIRSQYLSFSDFLERYDDDYERAELHQLSLGQSDQGQCYERTIATIWVFDTVSPAAQLILKVTSFLDPDCIPEPIYLEGASTLKVRDYPQSKSSLAAARAELIKASFIKRNAEKKEILVHRLVQDAMRNKMSLEEAQSVLGIAIHLILAVWPSGDVANKHNMARWKKCEKYYPHVLALSRAYEKLLQKNAIEPNFAFATLLNDAGWWQHERGNSHEVRYIFELALSICSRLDIKEKTSLLGDLHHSLGAIANETNDAKACLEHNKHLLEIRRSRFQETGVKDYRYASAYGQFGTALMLNNERGMAIEMYERCLTELRNVPGFTKGMTSVFMADLGFALWLDGDLEQAALRLEQGIKDREELFGKNDRESFKLGFLLHALGNVRWSQNRLEGSFELHRNALLQYKSTIGNSHHRTADVCHRVAKHYIRIAIYDQARILIDQAIKVWSVDRRIYKPELARTSFLKSKLCELEGNRADAAVLLKTAVELRQEITASTVPAPRPIHDLEEADFDELVTFWSR